MATTPTWRWPRTTAEGQYIHPDSLVVFQWSAYEDGNNLDHIQFQLGTVSGFASGVILDTGLREPDGVWLGDGWIEVSLARYDVAAGDTLYARVRIEDDAPSTSSYSAEATIETTSPPTFTRWRQSA